MNRREDQLFEAVRSVPVEISQEQVAQIIKALPLLPIPVESIWAKLFTFKSIIMNSVLISIVTGGILYLAQPTPTTNESVASIPTIPIAPIEQIQEAEPVVPTTPSLVDTPTPSEVSVSNEEAPQPNESNLAPSVTNPTIESEVNPKPSEESSTTSLLPTPLPLTFSPSPTPTLVAVPNPTIPMLASASDYQGPIKVKLLRRRLLSQLKNDHFIYNKKEIVEMFVEPNQFVINGILVDGKMKRKYLALLQKHRIRPYPNQQIRITPENIMVGILAGDDFEGVIIGTFDSDEEYPFIDDEEDAFLEGAVSIGGEGIILPGSGSLEPLIAVPSEGAIVQGEAVIVSPSGSTEDLFFFPSGAGVLADPHVDIATSPYLLSPTEEGAGIEVLIAPDDNIWVQLKSELLSNLVIDGYISNTQSQVLLLYQEGSITVNKAVLPPNFVQKYQQILRKYPIQAGPRSQIHITRDYLMAGEFDRAGTMIKGHIHGKTELEDDGSVQGLREY